MATSVSWEKGAGGGSWIELKKRQSCTFEQQEVSQGFPKFSLLPFPAF